MRTLPVAVIRIRGKGGLLLPCAVLNLLLGGACDSPSAPTPEQPGPPSITSSGYRISGVVTDDGGTPIPGAVIVANHGPNLPDLNEATQRATTTSGIDGRYEIVFKADQVHAGYSPFAMIRAYTLSGRLPAEYSPYAQLLDAEGISTVRNIRLRRTRIISAGQSTSMAIESDSSLCDIRSISATTICEWVVIRYSTWGTLTVEARPEAGSIVPTLQDWPRQGHGTLVMSVNNEDWDFVSVAVAVPIGTAPQRYEITTSLGP